jgi:hypothetical protein
MVLLEIVFLVPNSGVDIYTRFVQFRVVVKMMVDSLVSDISTAESAEVAEHTRNLGALGVLGGELN